MRVGLFLLFVLWVKFPLMGFADEVTPFTAAMHIAEKKVVKITGGTIGYEHGYASGILVSDDGVILTALGMFLSSRNLRVTLANGRTYAAEIMKRDRKKQLAMLKIQATTPDFFDIGVKNTSQVGDWILAIANPFKVANGTEAMSLSVGVISLITKLEVKRRNQDVEYEGDSILIDTITGNPGSQGGALVDLQGNLVGMIGKVLEYKGSNTRINYGIPLGILNQFIHNETTQEVPSKVVYIGVHLFLANGDKSPAFVDRVDLGSPAFLVGLQKDDLIISIGDKKILNCGEYQKAVSSLQSDHKIQIIFKRKEDFYRLDLKPKLMDLSTDELEGEDDDDADE